MSLHSSLKSTRSKDGTRSVMKRSERIKWLQDKAMWKEGDRVLGLPKIKVVKLKAVKKEKAKEEAPVEGTAPVPGAVAKTPAAKAPAEKTK